MMDTLLEVLSTWNVIRATGITAYVLLFLAVFAGVVLRLGFNLKKWKAPFLLIHQNAGWLTFFFGLVHGLLLIFDSYLPYTWLELFVPFAASHEPILSGLGTITFYLLLILLISSDIMQRLGKRVWKYLHFTSFPAFFFSLIHGLLLGTSSQDLLGTLLYIITGSLVVGVVLLKMMNSPRRENNTKPKRHVEVSK